jgi:hypothetical protein
MTGIVAEFPPRPNLLRWAPPVLFAVIVGLDIWQGKTSWYTLLYVVGAAGSGYQAFRDTKKK